MTDMCAAITSDNVPCGVLSQLERHGQVHLLHFWDQLSQDQRQCLLRQLDAMDMSEVVTYFRTAAQSLKEEVVKLDDRMRPIEAEQYGSSIDTDSDTLTRYRIEGLKRVSDGQVGVLLMAGGQGTRLGVSYPKGMYSVGLLSGKSLFQLQAERICRLQQLAHEQTKHGAEQGVIVWYIMTSEHTTQSTLHYFQENNYFGLDKSNVIMFEQGKLPCFDFQGKILLADKWKVSQAPDGNGGVYKALRDGGVLADMRARGIQYLHAHSVDNVLVQPADPVFLGYCIEKGADCGAKVVRKLSPSEAVGVVCKVDDSYQVVEYSEITESTAELRDATTQQLVFNAGNICNHFFTADFLQRIGNKHECQLKLHVAKKKIPYLDTDGQLIKPTVPNGIKVEKFVFDVFQFADRFVTWEVERNVEFSALKNADSTGQDCPSTAKSDLYALHRSYVLAAGGKVEGVTSEIELSPLLTYAGEGLEQIVSGKLFLSPKLIKSSEE